MEPIILVSARKYRVSNALAIVVAALLLLAPGTVEGQEVPGNLGLGWRELIDLNREALGRGQPGINSRNIEAASGRQMTGIFRLQVDSQNRVLTNIYVDGSIPAATIETLISEAGGSVAAADATYRNGVIAAYLPVAAAENLARMPGVTSLQLAHRAVTHAGLVTSQGATVLRSNLANQRGFNGFGITVGILSSSFNTSGSTDTALSDVNSGDLPNTTAIAGGEGLKFLIERDPGIFGPGTDEGRAMAQIVHDIAPNASLCFATGVSGEVDFANNIRALRANPLCNADVIVDDVAYFDEPFFSDGILAQAVDDVATSDTLPGHKVAYFSSAGNEAKQGYSSDLRIVPDGVARSIPATTSGVNLSTIPPDIDTSGGFHNFDANGGVNIAQDFSYSDGTVISFQWDDPFDLNPSGITTDLNLLFFDPVTGNFIGAVNDDNFITNQPLELFALKTRGGPGTSAEVLMVIARTGKGSHLARRIKYVAFGQITDMNGLLTTEMPVMFGHPSAHGANGVAAAVYATDPPSGRFIPLYEGFSSPGPAIIAFDKNGNRLARPEIRKKPDIAAVDGVNTTFFPPGPKTDYEAVFGAPDGFPNFFGTSAAATHAAGVAALLIQKAGGPGSISPKRVSEILKDSAPPRDTDLFFSEAVAANHTASVSVTATGEDLKGAGLGDSFFKVTFQSSKPGQTLKALTIDLTGTGLLFDPAPQAIHAGSSTGPVISSVIQGPAATRVTLTFHGFTSGESLTFGVNRGFNDMSGKIITEFGGNSGDEVAGAKITTILSRTGDRDKDANVLTGIFLNNLDRGYQIYDGFGLIDAVNALKLTPPYEGEEEGEQK